MLEFTSLCHAALLTVLEYKSRLLIAEADTSICVSKVCGCGEGVALSLGSYLGRFRKLWLEELALPGVGLGVFYGMHK